MARRGGLSRQSLAVAWPVLWGHPSGSREIRSRTDRVQGWRRPPAGGRLPMPLDYRANPVKAWPAASPLAEANSPMTPTQTALAHRAAAMAPTGVPSADSSLSVSRKNMYTMISYTHLRAHETDSYLVCRLLLEKKKNKANP